MRKLYVVSLTLTVVSLVSCAKEVIKGNGDSSDHYSSEDSAAAPPVNSTKQAVPIIEDDLENEKTAEIPTEIDMNPENIEQVKDICENGFIVTQNLNLIYPDSKIKPVPDACTNRPVLDAMLPELDSNINAFTLEAQKFQLPQNSILCGLNIKQINNNNFFYDDQFFLLLNNSILISSLNYNVKKGFEKSEKSLQYDIYKYDWNKLQETSINVGEDTAYCLGVDEASLINAPQNCQVPKTQKTGLLSYVPPDTVIQELYLMNKDKSEFSFNLITVGDNNTKIDCRHTALELSIQVKYATTPDVNSTP